MLLHPLMHYLDSVVLQEVVYCKKKATLKSVGLSFREM